MTDSADARGRPRGPSVSNRRLAGLLGGLAVAACVAPMPAPAAALPDGRAYEMVTPPLKPNEMGTLGGLQVGVTSDGRHFFFTSSQPVTRGTEDAPSVYRADRGEDGWNAISALPAGPTFHSGTSALMHFADTDLSVVVTTSDSFDSSDASPWYDALDLYRVAPSGDTLFQSPNLVDPTDANDGLNFVSASADGRDVVFEENGGDPRLPSLAALAVAPAPVTYEFRDGVLNTAAFDGTGNLLGGQRNVVGSSVSAFNAYSRDASRLFFTSDGSGGSNEHPGLYVRLNGSDLRPIPASPAGANANSTFVGATPNGHFAFFVTSRALLPSDTDSANDLYRYDTTTGDVALLTSGNGANVALTPVWSSDDGKRVYFTANGQLVPGMGSAGHAQTYVYDDGQIRYVADAALILPGSVTEAPSPQCGPTRVTPDGRFFLAQTTASLTGRDTDGGASDVYLYDVGDNSLQLISTGPLDIQDASDALIGPDLLNQLVNIPGCDATLDHVTRPMSDDGKFVFFSTPAQLVSDDANGRRDVYEWSRDTGTVSLITSGHSAANSQFLDATPSGDAAFFTTSEQLVGRDRDAQSDIYSARIDGGFPDAPSDGPPSCRESECQGVPHSSPSFEAPASASEKVSSSTPVRPAVRKLRLGRLSAAALRRLALTGAVRVMVTPPVSGHLVLSAALQFGTRTLYAGSKQASVAAAGRTVITLRLTSEVRRVLRRHGKARLLLTARERGAQSTSARYALNAMRGARR